MIEHALSRLVAGIGIARQSTAMYLTGIPLLALALVPTAVRAIQTLDGDGRPEASVASEAFVGVFRILLALAVMLIDAGWDPVRGPLRPPGLENVGSRWAGADFGEVIFDVASYAAIYGAINLVIAGLTSGPILGQALGQLDGLSVTTTTGLVRFVIKNAVVIPVATIHLMWALRLIGRPA